MSADTTKDFAPIQGDYAFFEDHTTEAAADIAAYLPHVRPLAEANRPVRMLDFGCGSGRFSAKFQTAVGFVPENLRLSLVEPVEDWRRQAIGRLSVITSHPVEAWSSLPTDRAGSFDLILANHCLYYTPELDATLSGLVRSLAPGGLFLAACAGRGNRLIQFWQTGYALIGKPIPHHTGDDVATTLVKKLGVPFAVQPVTCELAFDDTVENRAKIIRFLFGDDFSHLPPTAVLAFFDPFAADGRVRMDVIHEQYAVRAGV